MFLGFNQCYIFTWRSNHAKDTRNNIASGWTNHPNHVGTISSQSGGKIIQQEEISFEKCLTVIQTSQDKLSIAPKIIDESDEKRVAIFTLVDGTLTITCDGIEGKVTVSTNFN